MTAKREYKAVQRKKIVTTTDLYFLQQKAATYPTIQAYSGIYLYSPYKITLSHFFVPAERVSSIYYPRVHQCTSLHCNSTDSGSATTSPLSQKSSINVTHIWTVIELELSAGIKSNHQIELSLSES